MDVRTLVGAPMNKIEILAPRWRDRTVLIAVWKVGDDNEIEITAKKKDGTRYYPNPFHMAGEDIKACPVEGMNHGAMYIVPLSLILTKEAVK